MVNPFLVNAELYFSRRIGDGIYYNYTILKHPTRQTKHLTDRHAKRIYMFICANIFFFFFW